MCLCACMRVRHGRARCWACAHRRCLGELRMHTHSCRRGGGVSTDSGGCEAAGSGGCVSAWRTCRAVQALGRGGGAARDLGAPRGPAALTASWHSSRAGCAGWPPNSACRHGSPRGRSRSSGSAAPAAWTPAPRASVSPAGPPGNPAAASDAPVPAGSRSGPWLGLYGCLATLDRGAQTRLRGGWLPAPGGPSPNPKFPGSQLPTIYQENKRSRGQCGEVGEGLTWVCTPLSLCA